MVKVLKLRFASCLPKQLKQTAQISDQTAPEEHEEAVLSGSSLFAIFTSILLRTERENT